MEATEQQDGAARPGDPAAPDAGAAHDTSDSAAAQVAEDEGAPPHPPSAFSVAGQIVTAKRARLHPDTVTLLVFLHEAIPGGIEREAADIIQESLTESILVADD